MHTFACLVNSTGPLMRHSPGLLSIHDPTFSNQNKALSPSCRQVPSMTTHGPRWNILHKHLVQERFFSPLCSLMLISHYFQLNLYQWGFQNPPCSGLGVHADPVPQGLLCCTSLGASIRNIPPSSSGIRESQEKSDTELEQADSINPHGTTNLQFSVSLSPGGHLEQISCIHSVTS